jgi:hypothetical protein
MGTSWSHPSGVVTRGVYADALSPVSTLACPFLLLFSDAQNSAATGAVVGTVPAQESATANFLAIDKTTGKFYDISGTEKMDFVCQYRAPAPCSEGYRYFSPSGLDATNEFGMASCVKVFGTPATLLAAKDKCGKLKAQPINPNVVYAHLATYHQVKSGQPATPLTGFVKRIAQRRGITQTRFWTGAQLILSPGGADFVPSWQDNRIFDSDVITVAQRPTSENDGCVPRAFALCWTLCA